MEMWYNISKEGRVMKTREETKEKGVEKKRE